MTPIPWSNNKVNFQFKHRHLNERWDKFLCMLKNDWNQYNFSQSLTFKSYMLLTCQQIYYKDVYNNFKNDIKEINAITAQTINDWGKIIKENSELLSFCEYKEKSKSSLITELIKIRCHIIGLILQKHFEC